MDKAQIWKWGEAIVIGFAFAAFAAWQVEAHDADPAVHWAVVVAAGLAGAAARLRETAK